MVYTLSAKKSYWCSNSHGAFGPGTWKTESGQLHLTAPRAAVRVFSITNENEIIRLGGQVSYERRPPPPEVPRGFSPVGKWQSGKSAYTLKADKTWTHSHAKVGPGRWRMEGGQLLLTYGKARIFNIVSRDELERVDAPEKHHGEMTKLTRIN